MVKSITGKCNGVDIVFTPAAGRWETTVPASADGTYLVELWATDEAGNSSYFATVKVGFDTSQLCMAVSVLDIGVGWSAADVQAVFSGAVVSFETAEAGVKSDAFFAVVVSSKIVRCEVCGR